MSELGPPHPEAGASAQTESLAGVYGLRQRRVDPCRAVFAATESFGTPLWAIPLEISAGGEKRAISRSRRLARRVLRKGWVLMVEEDAAGSERELPLGEALKVLDRPEPWTPSGVVFSLVATEAGEVVYWRHAERRPNHRVGFNR